MHFTNGDLDGIDYDRRQRTVFPFETLLDEGALRSAIDSIRAQVSEVPPPPTLRA